MCGIIYSQSLKKKPVNERVYDQFNYQRSRGTQGFGLFDAEHGHLIRSTTEDRIVNWLGKEKNESTMILFHHRTPTSTINTKQANHPFTTKKYFKNTEYILIHNGHISNAGELFVKHQEQGIEYFSLLDDLTFTDSEALLWDFALTMEGKQEALTARGGNAMICLKLVDGKPKQLYFGRNSNPIYMTKDEDELHLSSQGLSFSPEAREKLPGKKEEMVKPNTLFTWNLGNHHLTEKPFTFPQFVVNPRPYNYGNYEYPRLTKKERKARKKWEREHNQSWDRAFTGSSYAADHANPSGSLGSSNGTKIIHLPAQSQTSLIVDSHREYLQVSEEEIATRCITYLTGAGGNFSKAAKQMKLDLEVICGQAVTDGNIHARIALRKAIKRLDEDPEWVDVQSVSSIWRALWQNHQHLTNQT